MNRFNKRTGQTNGDKGIGLRNSSVPIRLSKLFCGAVHGEEAGRNGHALGIVPAPTRARPAGIQTARRRLPCARVKLLVVVHTGRGDNIRVISARRASKRERKTYEEAS